MKVVFDHIKGFGKVSNQDFIYSDTYGLLEMGESEVNAFERGWIPWDGVWYNLRSVRLELSKYKPNSTTKKQSKNIKFTQEKFEDKPIYRQLYEKYCKHHKFERTITWEQLFKGDVITYHHNGIPIGYSTIQKYDTAFCTTQFVWDYETPKLSLGKVAQMYECEVAKLLNCTHIYILGGYEQCCLYKSDFKGFQWWTGLGWSEDIELYKTLCERDEKCIVVYDNI